MSSLSAAAAAASSSPSSPTPMSFNHASFSSHSTSLSPESAVTPSVSAFSSTSVTNDSPSSTTEDSSTRNQCLFFTVPSVSPNTVDSNILESSVTNKPLSLELKLQLNQLNERTVTSTSTSGHIKESRSLVFPLSMKISARAVEKKTNEYREVGDDGVWVKAKIAPATGTVVASATASANSSLDMEESNEDSRDRTIGIESIQLKPPANKEMCTPTTKVSSIDALVNLIHIRYDAAEVTSSPIGFFTHVLTQGGGSSMRPRQRYMLFQAGYSYCIQLPQLPPGFELVIESLSIRDWLLRVASVKYTAAINDLPEPPAEGASFLRRKSAGTGDAARIFSSLSSIKAKADWAKRVRNRRPPAASTTSNAQPVRPSCTLRPAVPIHSLTVNKKRKYDVGNVQMSLAIPAPHDSSRSSINVGNKRVNCFPRYKLQPARQHSQVGLVNARVFHNPTLTPFDSLDVLCEIAESNMDQRPQEEADQIAVEALLPPPKKMKVKFTNSQRVQVPSLASCSPVPSTDVNAFASRRSLFSNPTSTAPMNAAFNLSSNNSNKYVPAVPHTLMPTPPWNYYSRIRNFPSHPLSMFPSHTFTAPSPSLSMSMYQPVNSTSMPSSSSPLLPPRMLPLSPLLRSPSSLSTAINASPIIPMNYTSSVSPVPSSAI